MKILICGKGGCGKSTVAAILAYAMQKREKNALDDQWKALQWTVNNVLAVH